MRRNWMRFAMIAAAAGALLAAGCADTDETDDPTPVQTWKITPASTGQPPPGTPTPAATEAPGTPSADGTVLNVVGVSNTFDVEELTAPAGTITIQFDNEDAAVIHNIHFFAGDDASGEDIAATELAPGPVEQTLTMELEPGTYFYQCDAHPTTMKGILTVT
ncbi:MAG TPA: cupredoxin domain-containing protein [Dehalococcoidia bacterium]|nr:cupredoxin domain-containing protein [Dehalococcoidia bacterium]